jgi:serine kinase of HPr protein (carbohydrate metabolism regulator)
MGQIGMGRIADTGDDAEAMNEPYHAGLIALYDRGGWKGVLIEGQSGSGKSDLALRCLSRGFRLVADDRTRLWVSEGRLFGGAPEPIAGLIELRGIGVLPEPARRLAEVRLVVRCLEPADSLERMPDRDTRVLMGITLPSVAVRPLEASAPEKVARALSLLGGAG